MTRTEKFEARYRQLSGEVLSSIATVGAAGRTKQPDVIAYAQWRHYRLMAEVCMKLGI